MISFGNRIEPLVDDYLIAAAENLSFRLAAPRPLGKILGFDEPWEGAGSLGMTIFEDEGIIKCYYRGFPTGEDDHSGQQTSCLAVSRDGIHFDRLPINEISYDGITENNILRMDDFCHNFAPFLDTNPRCPAEEKYKAIGGILSHGGIHVFGSPDGIHWHPLADKPVITKGAFDSMNMAFYNPHTGLYHAYSRYFDKNLKSEIMPMGCRAIQSCTSEDFIHWSEPVYNQYAEGAPTDQLYTNATRPIPGAEHILLSLPMRFREMRMKVESHPSAGISDAVLMTSRDGVFWSRTVKEPWLSGGLYNHEWTQRNFIVVGGSIERGEDFYFYALQNYCWEDDGIWAYSLPRYRFMSLCADGDGGFFTTKPLRFESDDIHLNFATSAYGYVRITLLDPDGSVIFRSDEIYGNEISHPLHVDGLCGRCGTMKVELKEAHLYALGGDMQKKNAQSEV
ncbi:MAG: hypothetical protein IKL89_05635 [Clostridia bacterium]|nr:hypothetical protein [Clostridia bacterium]